MEAGDVISTGVPGYELCSAGVIEEDDLGTPIYVPVDITYDTDTGDVTVNEVVEGGRTVQFDFYTDGYFDNDLTDEMKNILG